MDNSSSEESADEEEVFQNFDEEAKKILQSETLPKKSADRYLLVHNTYKKWREENKNSLSNSEENNLIVYFESLKPKLKPPTLWSIWSMLKKTLAVKDNINISNFLNLKSIIKANAKGYKPKKAFVFKWEQILRFMNEAPDDTYLAMKVILIFGICGCLRCDEITNMKIEDVEDLRDKYLVSINANKNDYPGQFIIGSLFYEKVKRYISLRPSDPFSDRFFIKYRKGVCFRQPIGRHKIGAVAENIASYLQLKNPEKYTGHAFRRTSATLLSNSGANMQMIKQLGRWRSDMIAQGYIENSLLNKQMIYEGVTQRSTTTLINPQPSTSAQCVDRNYTNEELNFNINWADFEEDFDSNDNPSDVNSGFTTASNKKISVPNVNKNKLEPSSSKFFDKPGIKLNYLSQKTDEAPTCKEKKSNVNSECQNVDGTNSILNNPESKFNNCTFNDCIFNFTYPCCCNKKKTL